MKLQLRNIFLKHVPGAINVQQLEVFVKASNDFMCTLHTKNLVNYFSLAKSTAAEQNEKSG